MPGSDLVAQVADGLRGRADPCQPGVDDGLREIGVLGEEPVAGMHCVGPGPGSDVEELAGIEVGLARGGTAERIGLVGHPDMQGVPVGVGVHRYGAEAGIAAGSGDPDGDFAAVGDQDGLHRDSFGREGRVAALALID